MTYQGKAGRRETKVEKWAEFSVVEVGGSIISGRSGVGLSGGGGGSRSNDGVYVV